MTPSPGAGPGERGSRKKGFGSRDLIPSARSSGDPARLPPGGERAYVWRGLTIDDD